MRSIVIYDSWYGDTRRVAEEIARAIAQTTGVDPGVVELEHAAVRRARELDLIVLGTPNHFGNPTRKMRHFVRDLGTDGPFEGTVAVFDTCFAAELGKASAKLADLVRAIQVRGATPAAALSIVVEGTRGPLRAGELAKAHAFGVSLARTSPVRPIELLA